MAKVIFLQNVWFESMGVMYISSALKAAGHSCDMIIGNSASDFIPFIKERRPDIVAFSVTTGMHKWILEIAPLIKNTTDSLIVLGGPHPTFFPEVLYHKCIDVVCRGEGEDAMVELADGIDSSGDISRIRNLWVKTDDGLITKNDVRPFTRDIDFITFPDRQLYNRFPSLSNDPVVTFITRRGCPYNCSFCYNHQMRELYRGKGPYVRLRSPETVIQEITKVRKTRKIKRVYFTDDTFSTDKAWLRDFLPQYGERINLPFHCLIRINQIDEEIASLLRGNGCKAVFFGIESGNAFIRNRILDKGISDEDIRKGASILKKYAIGFRTYNMFGLPGETFTDALDTIRLNIEIGTEYPWCSLFMPFPKTRLAQFAMKKGFFSENIAADNMQRSFHLTSMITSRDRRLFINMHKFFQTAVCFPFTLPVIRKMIHLHENVFFQIWFGVVYFWLYTRSEGRGFFRTLRTATGNWRTFFKRE